MSQIYNTKGLKGFYMGVKPNTTRAMVAGAFQTPSYDGIKHFILNKGWMQEGMPLHFVSSIGAGIVASYAVSPVDVVKTRMMNDCTISPVYKNMLDCYIKIARNEGLPGLFKGVNANWMRLGPLTMIQFMVWEWSR